MRNGKTGELIADNENWKNELKVLEDGIIRFKTKLAGILEADLQPYELEQLEYFQNKFLKMDDQISLLRHEVREQLHLLQQLIQSNGPQLKKILDLQYRLEVKMIIIQGNFDKLSSEFSGYLQKTFS
ncbi:hypothetical protein SAMN04488505_10260 [Chitinophaga rupis]|uniref:Uncharacterized protein n=1 Tax=Chitinophaga rupis TaxID=573321 RepID=A0A1H7PEQ3_9BACT|nr:hypothetical protein [Chitinophaga rupis]SEL33894.1 hypothetical protein SAMN04488505_10260 [Chitinophaga rupis]